MKELEKVTRVEVIDENGRSYTNWDNRNEVSISFQDDGRTAKIFIKKDTEKKKEPNPFLDMTPYKNILKDAYKVIHDQDYPPDIMDEVKKTKVIIYPRDNWVQGNDHTYYSRDGKKKFEVTLWANVDTDGHTMFQVYKPIGELPFKHFVK